MISSQISKRKPFNKSKTARLMSKYIIIELNINNNQLVDYDQLSQEEQNALHAQNVVYVYRGSKSKKVYIGQTGHFYQRHIEHYSGAEEKFNTANFDKVLVILSQYFDRSALDDVESQLITYFVADYKNSRAQTIQYDSEVINKTAGNSVNYYTNKEKVATEVILPVWQNELYPRKWVSSPTIDKIRASVLVKYSPIKELTNEQGSLITEILNNPEKSYVINGDAGTGKTVLLTHLVAKVLQDRPNARIGVVVQPNWEKTAVEIFKIYGMNNSLLTVATSTKLIKEKQRYDIIVVDESHKLSRKYGKQHPSFGEVYDIPEFANCNSHLEILQKLGSQIILMYDVLQGIRPANIPRETFLKLTSHYEKKFLTTQFRIQAQRGRKYTSDDYINGIKYLLYKDTGLLCSELTKFNPNFNRDVFRDTSPNAYFGYVKEQPLHKLIDWLDEDKNFHPNHVNRVLAGLVEDWRQKHGKNPSIKHWHEGDIHRRWNSTQDNWINSTDDDAEEQIGSIFAVQGIDLNKVGVLIGKDLEVQADGTLKANPDNFFNVNGVFTDEEMEIAENRREFTLFVLNIYYVLLTRGIDGIRVGFWKNDAFRKYMEKTLEIT